MLLDLLKFLKEISILADQRVHLITSKRSHLENDLEVHLSVKVVYDRRLDHEVARAVFGFFLWGTATIQLPELALGTVVRLVTLVLKSAIDPGELS